MVRYWRSRSRPYCFRSPTPSLPDPPSMCRSAAAARLWLEHGVVADTAAELRAAYRNSYGSWPFEETSDARTFYRREYTKLWDVADRVLAILRSHPLAAFDP